MPAPSAEDELLLILLRNLRNAAATFGEDTSQYDSIKRTVEEHLQDMKRKGLSTNVTQARKSDNQPPASTSAAEQDELYTLLANLTLTPKLNQHTR